MKPQKRVIASMLAGVMVLMLLIVFPHAETAGGNASVSSAGSGFSQSSVMGKALNVSQSSSAGQTSAVVQNSRSNPSSKASRIISSGQTSSAGKSSSAVPASSASQSIPSGQTSSAGLSSSAVPASSVSQQSAFVQPSSGVASSAKGTPESTGTANLTDTVRSAALTGATISPQTIADGLGTAAEFALFARKFTLNCHMEGNVAVEAFAATTGNIGNSANIYTHNQSGPLTFDLTISISGIAKKSYQVGIYTDAAAKNLFQKVSLTADSEGNAATTISGLDSKKVYYAYLLDNNGNPVLGSGTSQQGITGGGSVVYSCNDSYIQTLTDPLPIGWEIFQKAVAGSTVIPQSATFGNKYLLYRNAVNIVYQTTGDGSYTLYDPSKKENVINTIGGGTDNTVSIKDTFPFSFDDVFTSLSGLSKTLAGAHDCDNTTMRVINVTPSGNREDALRDALITALGYQTDQNALTNPDKGIPLADKQYLVVNVTCGNNTSVTIPPCCIGKVAYSTDWNDISSRILWNFYGGSSSLTVKTTSGVLGTILAPTATVNYGSTMNGAIYADTVYNGTGEIHKMTFRPTPNVTRSISFTDHSTPPFTLPETGGPGTGIFYLAGGGILLLAAAAVLIHRVTKHVISARGERPFDHIHVFLPKHRLSIYPQRTENNSS